MTLIRTTLDSPCRPCVGGRMKRVTLTFTMDFDDDVPDDKCLASANEVLSQDGNFPSDDQFKIEHVDDLMVTRAPWIDR